MPNSKRVVRQSKSPKQLKDIRQKKPLAKRKNLAGFPRTDAGNAEFFAALTGKNLRYDHQRGRWLIWRQHWGVEDTTQQVMQFAKNAARSRLKLSAEIEDDDVRQKEAKWALNNESLSDLTAMLKLAQSESPLAVAGKDWDSDPWLLGVANGVIDLRTGKLRAGNQTDRITLHTVAPYEPGARCEVWLKFLADIFGNDSELIGYLQRCLGYSLTASVRDQCIFYLWGAGANGKTTFLEAVSSAFGPYAGAAPFSMLEHKNKAAIPSDVASTAGKRFITVSETDESIRLNESRVKSMTGGDMQSARFMYKDWFQYRATAKIWLAFNHKPEIQDDSHGMWRRVRLIPFSHVFEGHKEDKTFLEKLKVEAAGILAWIVRGCLEWQKQGLREPAIVTLATEQYRKENDKIGSFIEDCCEVAKEFSVPSASLWSAYQDWANNCGEPKLDRTKFTSRLVSRGFKNGRMGHDRTRILLGLKLTLDVSTATRENLNNSPSAAGQETSSLLQVLVP
jgi:putative DNA primase/helicase